MATDGNFVSIGTNGPDGGYRVVSWGIDADGAALLTAELTDRIGVPDIETVTDDEGLAEMGRAVIANAVANHLPLSGTGETKEGER